ncbi:MAG: hypothetical protein HY721_16470 [Planctomycetes bacterium]|nr:hypothetical protein [Planctomycetota bacterium]
MVSRGFLLFLCLCLSAAAATGCGNYAFRDARTPEGKHDLARLRADLEAKRAPLMELSWIPLVRSSFTGFKQEREEDLLDPFNFGEPSLRPDRYPDGFTLVERRGYGPLGAYASACDRHYDPSLALYEVREGRSVLWRLWSLARSRVKTPLGVRVETRQAILFGLVPLPPGVGYWTTDAGVE